MRLSVSSDQAGSSTTLPSKSGRKNSVEFTALFAPKLSKAVDSIPGITEDEAYAASIHLKEKMIGTMQKNSDDNYKGPELPSRYEGNARLRSRSTCEKLVSNLVQTSEGVGARVPGAKTISSRWLQSP